MTNNNKDTIILLEFKLKDVLIMILLAVVSLVFWNYTTLYMYGLLSSLLLLPIIISFVILTICDYKYFILPNGVNYFLVCYGLIINYFSFYNIQFATIQQSLIGAGFGIIVPLLFRLLFNRILGRESFGLGDVKMLAGIGALFGGMVLLQSIFFASVLGIVYYIIMYIFNKKTPQYIPYGSCLGLVCLFPLFFNQL